MVDRYHCGDICNEQNEHKSLLRWLLLPRPLPTYGFFLHRFEDNLDFSHYEKKNHVLMKATEDIG